MLNTKYLKFVGIYNNEAGGYGTITVYNNPDRYHNKDWWWYSLDKDKDGNYISLDDITFVQFENFLGQNNNFATVEVDPEKKLNIDGLYFDTCDNETNNKQIYAVDAVDAVDAIGVDINNIFSINKLSLVRLTNNLTSVNNYVSNIEYIKINTTGLNSIDKLKSSPPKDKIKEYYNAYTKLSNIANIKIINNNIKLAKKQNYNIRDAGECIALDLEIEYKPVYKYYGL